MGILTEQMPQLIVSEQIKQKLYRPMGADAVRVLAVGIVGWYHIWQQSWVSAGAFDLLPRTGYVWVDMMILLSAFCLFLPYAADRCFGIERKTDTKQFYKKRAVRILPAYFLCVAVHFVVTLLQNGWTKGLGLDLAAHCTLTQTFFLQSYWFTKLGGSLWTVGILAGFYLLFPFWAKAAVRFPLRSFAVAVAVQAGVTLFGLSLQGNEYLMIFNRLPAFVGVLGLGMALAAVYAHCVTKQKKPFCAWCLLGAVGVFGLIVLLLKNSLLKSTDNRVWQLAYRMPLAVLFGAFLLLCCLGLPQANRKGIFAFLSAISYSFYLWHQSIAVWLKQAKIPHWQGDVPPNQLWDKEWMAKYNLLCWVAAFAAAIISFLLAERGFARLFVQKLGQKQTQNQTKSQQMV